MRPLTPAETSFLAEARTAVLATTDPAGRPRLVPICFVVPGADGGDAVGPLLYTPLDEKPKRVADPHELARVRDIAARPEVTVLVDRWDEDWRRLAWLRLHGRAELIEPADAARATERATAIAALRAKYPQYATHGLASSPLIRIAVQEVASWGDVAREINGGAAGPRPGG
jgi:PPOX class probable F420-dependent enzyme